MFVLPSPLASYQTTPETRDGVSDRVVGRGVGRGVLIISTMDPIPNDDDEEEEDDDEDDEEEEVSPLLSSSDKSPVVLASNAGLQGYPSSNRFHAFCQTLPSPGGLYPRKDGALQYTPSMH